MSKWGFGVFTLYCVLLMQQIIAQTTIQTCKCVKQNTCYQNITTDGSGVIDIRIVNGGGGGAVTVPPPSVTTLPPATIKCLPDEEPCCSPNSGCGVRYNIPLTPPITPSSTQGRYGSQPWQAVIVAPDNSFLGSGVLLDSMNVLTAAHKVINRTEASLIVRLGDWNRIANVETNLVENRTVSKIIRHPNFTANNLFNDVAILRLSTPIVIGSNPAINNACPPGASTNYDNLSCLVSGWGRDTFSGSLQTILKEVYVPIVPSATCQDELRKNTKLGASFVLNTNSFICAGAENGKDACIGDGGSPLMCNVGGKYQVVGLVAWGIGCGTAAVPGVYVRVQSFWPWIQQNMV